MGRGSGEKAQMKAGSANLRVRNHDARDLLFGPRHSDFDGLEEGPGTTREAFEKFCLNTNKLKLYIAKMGFHNLFMP